MQTTPLGELYQAVRARADAEQAIADAVTGAHATGSTWNVIGQMLGTSGEAARQRYGRQDSGPTSRGGRERTRTWTTRSRVGAEVVATPAKRRSGTKGAAKSTAAESKRAMSSVERDRTHD